VKHLFVLLIFALPLSAQDASLTLDDAIAMALDKNTDIVIERESLAIADATVLRANAAYEPSLRGEARFRDRTDPVNSILSGAPAGEVAPNTRSFLSSASLIQLLPTGASVSVFTTLNRDRTNSILALLTPSWSTGLGAEIRQPLMQNRRIDPARRAIRIARVDRARALSTLRRATAETVAAVERAYWNAVAARRDVEIRESNLRVAEKQREDTRVRIQAGTQPEADLSTTTAEVERRRGDLFLSRENALRAGNALRSLIARDASDPVWDKDLDVNVGAGFSQPTEASKGALNSVSTAIELAFANRPELEEITHRLERQDVEIEAALDRVRPQVDLVAAYNGRGLAGSENQDAISPFGRPVVVPDAIDGSLDRSLGTIAENRFPDASLGVAFSLPIGNTAAKQDVAIARALRRQTAATIDAVRQRIAVEVRNALAALTSAEQRIDAARASRVAAEVQLQAERDRFEAGTSNSFFILTRQNDLASARLAEVVALADYAKARVELARATGSLLADRSIEIADAVGGSR
jgi:outer membrane protein